MWGGVVIFMVVLLGVGFWYVARASYIRVKHIEITGTNVLSPKGIEDVVLAELHGALWLFVPRDNILVVSSKGLEAHLAEQFPSMAEVDVTKSFPDAIRVRIRERALWGVYCETRPIPEKPHPCAYLDEGGIVFQEFSNIEGWLLPVVIGSATPTLGEVAVSGDMLGFFQDARDALGKVDVKLLSLRESTTTPEDLSLGTGEGWEIRIPKQRPVSEWFPILKTLLDKEIGAKRSQLEYIDLRFGQKVFYKLK